MVQEICQKIKGECGGNKPSEEVFGRYAEEFSQCPSNAKGGLLGYFGKGQMDPNFEEIAFKTPVGQMSEVIETANGFHILMVVETK
jgi:parvulin-like peptidyl-prolyl isomerase